MSSLGAKARFNRLGGSTGTRTITPPAGVSDTSAPLPVIDATTARTAAVTDNNRVIEFTNAAAINFTIKAYSAVPLPIGAVLIGLQSGVGQVTFVADGVTFETSDSYKSRTQGSYVAMQHVALNRWKALGDQQATLAACSVLGRSANSAGAPAAITATADLQALIRRAGALVFDLIVQSDISGLVAALAAKAPLASPTFTGVPLGPTAAPGTNTTQLATTAFTQAAIAALVASSPAALDTLNELAAALGNDPNFATTITTALAAKAPLASPAFTGAPTGPTAAPGTSNTQLATTAFVVAAVAAVGGSASGVAVVDAGGYFTGTDVEAVLQELATMITSGGQSSIQFKDEGSNIGSLGAINAIDFTGAGVNASVAGTVLTVDITGGGGGGSGTSIGLVQQVPLLPIFY